jgi:hypothetical protein
MEHCRGTFKAGGAQTTIAVQKLLCRKFSQKGRIANEIGCLPLSHTLPLPAV